MSKVFDLRTKKFIDLPTPQSGETDAAALLTAMQLNGHLLKSLEAVTAKYEKATTALKAIEARLATAEAARGAGASAETKALMDGLAAANTSIAKLTGSVGKLADDVRVIRDKPASVVPAAPPSPTKVTVPAPVVDMPAILAVIRAELSRAPAAPTSKGPVITTIVERDANGYVSKFVTKPLD